MFWLVAPRHRTKRACLCYMDFILLTLYRFSPFPFSHVTLFPLYYIPPSLYSLAHHHPLSLSLFLSLLTATSNTLPFILRSLPADKNHFFSRGCVFLDIKTPRLYSDMHEKKTQLGPIQNFHSAAAVGFDGEGIF